MAEKALRANPPQETTFVWQGRDRGGKEIRGESRGVDATAVRVQLRQQGVHATRIRKKPQPLFGKTGKSITPRDIAVVSRQLATMIDAGVPLVQAFGIIAQGHDNLRMRKLLHSVEEDLTGGQSLSQALAQHPKYFDDLYCSLVEAGEQSGALDAMLDQIATYREKTESLKSKIKKALFYPAAVVVVAFIVTAVLLIWVIPQFESLFQGFGADLPALTRTVISLSEFFQQWWWAIFGGVIAFIFAIFQARRRSIGFRYQTDRLMLKLPVIGPILDKATVARYARTLSVMFAAGVPLVEALGTVAGAVGNLKYERAILRIRDDVSTGQQLNFCMHHADLFPAMVVQMVGIGEEAGSLETMLSKVAAFYEEEVDNLVDALSSLLEPLIMAVLGVLVGGLVVAMYLPIFKMGSVV